MSTPDPNSAIFVLGEHSWITHLWFIGAAGYVVLAMIWRDEPGAALRGRVRIRMHHSPDPWDKEDEKTIFDCSPQDGESDEDFELRAAEVLDQMTQDVVELAQKLKQPRPQIWNGAIDGGPQKLSEILRAQPWAYTKTVETVQ
jgi:hypothetical protein